MKLHMCDFLSLYNGNHMFNLSLISCYRKYFILFSLIIYAKFRSPTPHPHPTHTRVVPGVNLYEIEWVHPLIRGKAPAKNLVLLSVRLGCSNPIKHLLKWNQKENMNVHSFRDYIYALSTPYLIVRYTKL